MKETALRTRFLKEIEERTLTDKRLAFYLRRFTELDALYGSANPEVSEMLALTRKLNDTRTSGKDARKLDVFFGNGNVEAGPVRGVRKGIDVTLVPKASGVWFDVVDNKTGVTAKRKLADIEEFAFMSEHEIDVNVRDICGNARQFGLMLAREERQQDQELERKEELKSGIREVHELIYAYLASGKTLEQVLEFLKN